jgi:RNA polymerase sigma-70 factor, ECF subfamily
VPEPRPIDDDLLNALRSGDACALSTVYEVFSGMVYRVAWRFTGSKADAEDVLQDVFIALPESVGRLESVALFEAWLKRMAVRTSIMRQRSVSRRARAEADADPASLAGAVSEDMADRFELEQAIERLPDVLRYVFVLRQIEGFQHAEIAEMLDISERASQQRMHRARARLRLLLSG